MKNKIVLLLFLIWGHYANSQTTLFPGDMAFLSAKVGSGDGFSVITFKDLCPNTIIYFTDNPYRNASGFCTSGEEFCVSLTVTTTIPAGSQITYNDGAPGTFSFSGSGAGTISFVFNTEAGTNNGFSSSGDNCFAFQGSYAFPSFICSIKTSAYTASGGVSCTNRAHTELPSALTLGTNALFVNVGATDGIYYNCPTTSGTQATLLAAMNNSANWITGTQAITRPCTFTVTDAVPAVCAVSCVCNVWSEDFNTTRYPSRSTTGANSNIANPAADWTTTFLDCDDATPYGTTSQSYWGTINGEFLSNDIEGGPCSCSTGGTTRNEWVTEVIDITGYTDVSACVSFRNTGTMEPNTSAACNNADDVIQGHFKLDGGSWQGWFFDDGAVNLSPATVSGLNGNSLQLRIYVGSKANDEFHYFDNVCVTGTPVPLPLEWLSFSATLFNNESLLLWKTATEANTNYFEIEKSSDGFHFSTIGLRNAAGNSSFVSEYYFKDTDPFPGINYYRIKEVDNDGESTYSPIRGVNSDAPDATTIVYTNYGVNFTFGCEEINEIEIYSVTGGLIKSMSSVSTLNITNSELPAGIYFLRLYCHGAVESYKFLIG